MTIYMDSELVSQLSLSCSWFFSTWCIQLGSRYEYPAQNLPPPFTTPFIFWFWAKIGYPKIWEFKVYGLSMLIINPSFLELFAWLEHICLKNWVPQNFHGSKTSLFLSFLQVDAVGPALGRQMWRKPLLLSTATHEDGRMLAPSWLLRAVQQPAWPGAVL